MPTKSQKSKPNQAKTRSNNITVSKRVNSVMEWLIQGYSRRYILEAAKKLNWNVTDKQTDLYIAKAKARFETDIAQVRRKQLIGLSQARFEKIFNKAVLNNDLKAAIAAEKEKNTLLGINALESESTDNEIRFKIVYS